MKRISAGGRAAGVGKMRVKRRRRTGRRRWKPVLFVMLAALFALYVYYAIGVRGRTEPKTRRTETNRDAAVFKSEKHMRNFMGIRFPTLASKVSRTYVIPGLKATKTLMGEFRAPTMCTTMTPQGMCVTEKYIFVSAYCHAEKHSSVFYMLDKEDGRLIRTIPLGMMAHVGGMAYDPKHRIVWVSGGTQGAAKAVGYNLEDLENYDENSAEPATARFNYTLATMTRNSYMNYWQNMLVMGIFTKKGRSEVSWFGITEEGGLYAQIFRDYDPDHESVGADYTAVTSREIQGVSIGENRLLLSKSYGPIDSALRVFDYEPFGSSFLDKEARRTIRMPQKLEQICEADGKLYCLFESGAYSYRAQPLVLVDRILVFDAEELLG